MAISLTYVCARVWVCHLSVGDARLQLLDCVTRRMYIHSIPCYGRNKAPWSLATWLSAHVKL